MKTFEKKSVPGPVSQRTICREDKFDIGSNAQPCRRASFSTLQRAGVAPLQTHDFYVPFNGFCRVTKNC